MLRPITATAVGLGAMLSAYVSAHAAPAMVTVSERVPYGDLDLTRRNDAAVMLRRIRAAAERVCEAPRTPLLLSVEARAARCKTRAVDEAVTRLNSPQVAALHGRTLAPPALAQAEPPPTTESSRPQ